MESQAPAAPPVAGAAAAKLTEAELAGIKNRQAATWNHIAGQRYPTEEMAAEALNDNEDLLAHIEWQANELTDLRARLTTETAAAATLEVEKLRLLEEARKVRAAIVAASSSRLSPAEREAYASNTNGQGTRGAYGAGQIMGRVSLAQDLLALFSSPDAAPIGNNRPLGDDTEEYLNKLMVSATPAKAAFLAASLVAGLAFGQGLNPIGRAKVEYVLKRLNASLAPVGERQQKGGPEA